MRKLTPWGAALALAPVLSCGSQAVTGHDLVPHASVAEFALSNGASYALKPAASAISGGGLCLDVRDAVRDDSAIVQLWTCNGTDAQAFVRKGHALQLFGNKCLAVRQGQSYSGGKVQLEDCVEGAPNQAWESEERRLHLRGSNVCLDVVNGLLNRGAGVQVWQCDHYTANQKFVADKLSEGTSRAVTDSNTVINETGRKIVWHDEFDQDSLDADHWHRDVEGEGGQTQQRYTSDGNNSFIEGGMLHIKAIKQAGDGKPYTSARLTTEGLASWRYGRFEVRLKVPCGQGFWPGASMLPQDSNFGPWPQSGELDIMEVLGGAPDTVHFTAQFGDVAPNNRNKGSSYSMSSGDFCQDFHVFALERTEQSITWSVDGEDHFTLTPEDADYAPAAPWPFAEPFYLVLNVAMGGSWAKEPDANLADGEMVVDYVRVYAPQDSPH